jgi:hypothetical protein
VTPSFQGYAIFSAAVPRVKPFVSARVTSSDGLADIDQLAPTIAGLLKGISIVIAGNSLDRVGLGARRTPTISAEQRA